MMETENEVKLNWTVKHTLTEQDFRKMIMEKLERAKMLSKIKESRQTQETE